MDGVTIVTVAYCSRTTHLSPIRARSRAWPDRFCGYVGRTGRLWARSALLRPRCPWGVRDGGRWAGERVGASGGIPWVTLGPSAVTGVRLASDGRTLILDAQVPAVVLPGPEHRLDPDRRKRGRRLPSGPARGARLPDPDMCLAGSALLRPAPALPPASASPRRAVHRDGEPVTRLLGRHPWVGPRHPHVWFLACEEPITVRTMDGTTARGDIPRTGRTCPAWRWPIGRTDSGA